MYIFTLTIFLFIKQYQCCDTVSGLSYLTFMLSLSFTMLIEILVSYSFVINTKWSYSKDWWKTKNAVKGFWAQFEVYSISLKTTKD